MITGKSPPNPLPCGCGIKGTPYIAMYGSNCDLRQEYRNQFIEFCPLHSAAGALLSELQNLIQVCGHNASGLGPNLRGKRILAQVARSKEVFAAITLAQRAAVAKTRTK